MNPLNFYAKEDENPNIQCIAHNVKIFMFLVYNEEEKKYNVFSSVDKNNVKEVAGILNQYITPILNEANTRTETMQIDPKDMPAILEQLKEAGIPVKIKE